MKTQLYILLLLLEWTSANAQLIEDKYYFQNLNIYNGLSQNTVNAILQDGKGFMWFGTKDGLNRYDGHSFREYRYKADKELSLGNNFITKLYEDAKGCIWVGTDAGLYVYFPEKDSFERFDRLSVQKTRIERTVSMITSDAAGRLWFAIDTQGLFCYDYRQQTFVNYPLTNFPTTSTNIDCLSFADDGTVWVGFYGDGLFYSKDQLKTIVPYQTPLDKQTVFKGDPIIRIVKGAYDYLYVCSIKGGLREINLTSGRIRDLLTVDENGERIFCRDLIVFSDHELWLGTETGVYIYNLKTDQYTHLQHSPSDPYSLSDNAIYSLYKDREDGVWIGSYFGGVGYHPKQYTYFEKYYPKDTEGGMHGKHVREFCPDTDGTLWIGTEDGGLNHFDPQTGRFRFFAPSQAFNNIHGLCVDGDYLWVGTFAKGLKRIHKRTGQVMKDYMRGYSIHSFDNSVFSIFKTASGDLYIGTSYGLHLYNRQKDDFDPISELKGRFIYDIREDSFGNLWAATYAHGVFRYNINAHQWENYVFDEKEPGSLPYNKILSVFEDSHRQIWLTTQGRGFCRFDPKQKSFVRYDSQMGLPNDVVYQIVEDEDGDFWLTTNRGLVKFDPRQSHFKTYTTADGLLCNQFNYRSSFRDPKGDIYFGGINGFIRFNPKRFMENKNIPSVVITDLLLFNREVSAGEENSPLQKSITFSDEIILGAAQNSFSLRLASLGCRFSEFNKISYQLEGFDNEWRMVGESPLVTYSNLEYGYYTFKAKAFNGDGVSSEKELELRIRILPPFYLTFWAQLFYVLLGLLVALYTILYFRKRSFVKHQRQTEKFEQEKEREVYDAKIDFFTHVAHEIRTPLTLIKGPLENIILKKEFDTETREELNIMEQNTERLLHLTNQLLDFRRIEARGYQLNFVKCDITDILRETYQRFTSLVRQKGIEMTIDLPNEPFYAHVNREALTKIISNLLNNAVKYANSYIIVSLDPESRESNNRFEIKVVNDGRVVPLERREDIFKPFVRVNEEENGTVATGTGIGLALARSLAELHRGSLGMDKDTDQNRFCLTLPVVQQSSISMPGIAMIQESDVVVQPSIVESIAGVKKNRFSVLLVEDNPDMLTFVSKQFVHDYTVLTASNGVEALRVLDENYVNMVITDVVMPQMDGFELCKTIKSNLEYSHIPVILLTAKTNIQSKIEGLESGADAYIEKPFSVEYLKVSVSNLIASRENLRKTFALSPFVPAHTMALTKADDEFMKKLNAIIQSNLHNTEFCMEDMADALNMSRSSFYRKIKGVLDLSPNEYLRIERLKQAAQLLKEGESRVTEICYRVGFNSPSYFAKCFQKQFGVLPKDFMSLSS